MKIKKISLSNFRTYAKTEMAPAASVAIVFAKNWTGKTTLRDAVSLGLVGEIQGQGKGGLTFERLIRTGESSGTIGLSLGLQGGKTLGITRRLTGKGMSTRVSLDDVEAGNDPLAYVMPGLTNASSLVNVLVNGGDFFSWDPREQKDTFLSLIPRDIPADLLASVPFGDRIARPATLDDAETVRLEAEERRRGAKRTLGALRVVEKPSRAVPPVQEIEEKIAALQAEARALTMKVGGLAGERSTLQEEHRRLEKEQVDLRKRLAPLGTQEEADRRLSLALDQVEAVRLKVQEWDTENAKLVAQDRELADLTSSSKKLATLKSHCVIGGGIVCPLPEGQKASIRNEWDKRIKDMAISAQRAKLRVGERPSDRQANIARADAEAAVTTVRNGLAREIEMSSRVQVIEARIAQIDENDSIRDIARIDARILVGQQNLTTAKEIVVEWGAYEKSLTARREAEEEVEVWDAIAKALGPGGVQVDLIKSRADALTTQINAVMSGFGFRFEVMYDPWEIRVGGAHPRLMSEAQRLMAGFALQVAIAAITKTGFLFVDGIDKLDAGNRGVLLKTLKDVIDQGWIEQAFLTATYVADDALTRHYPSWIEPFLAERNGDGPATIRSLR